MSGADVPGTDSSDAPRITFLHPGPPEGPAGQHYALGREAGRRIYEQQLAGQPIPSLLRSQLAELRPDGESLCFMLDRAPGLANGFQFTCLGPNVPRLPRRRRAVKCLFEEGILAGLVEAIAGEVVYVEEVQCRGGGADACLFSVRSIEFL